MSLAPLTFDQFVTTPENQAGAVAARHLAQTLRDIGGVGNLGNPLVLHGPPGTGKTHLVSALVDEVARSWPEAVILALGAGEFIASPGNFSEQDTEFGQEETLLSRAETCDLLVVDDLQHLPVAAVRAFVALMDARLVRDQPMVFTANHGPQGLMARPGPFPRRFINRLASGMVVRLHPLGLEGRRQLLDQYVEGISLGPDVMPWLLEHLGNGTRQLVGMAQQLRLLADLHRGHLDLPTIQRQFPHFAEGRQLTLEKIARSVGTQLQVEWKQLRSARRSRAINMARQVSMYLARQMTSLSLVQIGQYFGNRDHATVLHACRKVEESMATDVGLAGLVRELKAGLS